MVLRGCGRNNVQRVVYLLALGILPGRLLLLLALKRRRIFSVRSAPCDRQVHVVPRTRFLGWRQRAYRALWSRPWICSINRAVYSPQHKVKLRV